jgi:hypothetical protein
MPAPKAPESPSGKTATLQQGKAADARKPWKKKTPVEVVLEQENKLRKEIAEAEEDLKQKRAQLKKFEEARRIFEAS